MKIVAWATDIHLDCVSNVKHHIESLAQAANEADCVFISGDISVAPSLPQHLRMLDELLGKPIYFVLGNHDFYFSDIETVRRKVVDTCRSSSFLNYLPSVPFVRLETNVALVGHDGWYDAGNGSVENSQFIMNDWIRIRDYSEALRPMGGGVQIQKHVVAAIARRICQDSVRHVANGIKLAVREGNTTIVVMTHVPPFAESCLPSKHKPFRVEDALPWYTSKSMGDVLLAAARAFPDRKFIVISGHVHSQFKQNILANLEVRVGKSVYGEPALAGIIPI
jgi:predicted phosphohydrolase